MSLASCEKVPTPTLHNWAPDCLEYAQFSGTLDLTDVPAIFPPEIPPEIPREIPLQNQQGPVAPAPDELLEVSPNSLNDSSDDQKSRGLFNRSKEIEKQSNPLDSAAETLSDGVSPSEETPIACPETDGGADNDKTMFGPNQMPPEIPPEC